MYDDDNEVSRSDKIAIAGRSDIKHSSMRRQQEHTMEGE